MATNKKETPRVRIATGKKPGKDRSDWKPELKKIIDENNARHARRKKGVAHRTREARRLGIFRCFTELHGLGFQVLPTQLQGRHVDALMQYWTAAPELPAALLKRHAKLAPRTEPLGIATIQQRLSFLRTYAGWIGKRGMVLRTAKYVKDSKLARRDQTAKNDHSWSAHGVAPETMLEAIFEFDPHVATQLELMFAFGLRRKEAIMFRPAVAMVPRDALPPGTADDDRFIASLRIKAGAKGGRLRMMNISQPRQRLALEHAREIVRYANGNVGRPGLSLKQSLDRFSYTMRKFGITRARLGITAHGLRHQFANDLYFELTGFNSPVRGGDPDADLATMRAAYLEVACQLGHARPNITSAYSGKMRPLALVRRDAAVQTGAAPAPAPASASEPAPTPTPTPTQAVDPEPESGSLPAPGFDF
jgi:integrase